jgi:cephalosporin hydroxylase
MAPLMKMLQDAEEISAFVECVRAEGCKSFLEVGSKYGASLERVAAVLPVGSRVVSVDLPNGTKEWKQSSVSLQGVIDKLKRDGYDAHVIWGNSTDPKIIAQVKALGPFDCVFIDADHRLPGVTADWNTYGPMGKLVAFHDIGWKRAPEWVGTRIDVPEFWNSIKDGFLHDEYKFCPTGKNNGIGVLWRH